MQYQHFDPTGCDFPTPQVSILPALSLKTFGKKTTYAFKPLGPDANSRLFTRGRYALTEAYRLAGVGPNGTLLAPAYHCRTMLDPAIRLEADIVLYQLKADLSPDLDALTALLATCQKPIKALLLTHYFGFAQTLKPVADFCKQHGIVLVEDCSHALFIKSDMTGTSHSNGMGQTGHFCVASPYKFFPSEDGGMLWSNSAAVPCFSRLSSQPWKQELKAIVHAMQHARAPVLSNNKSQSIDPEHMDYSCGRDVLEHTSGISPYYQPEQEHLKSFAFSRWVMRHTNIDRLAKLRRQNYITWTAAVANLPHCSALFPKLPHDSVPYMFPLYIDHPETDFFTLKQLGIPIWRWDDMAVSDCAVASNYRLHLLHLPCHQELSETQMNWMTTTLQNVMLQPEAGHPA
jgi:hypothetical protein